VHSGDRDYERIGSAPLPARLDQPGMRSKNFGHSFLNLPI